MLNYVMFENCLDIKSKIEELKNQSNGDFKDYSLNKLIDENIKSKTVNSKDFYNLTSNSWGIEEQKKIVELISKNQLTMGSNVKRFEKLFCNFIGSKYSVMVNSGSSANLLIIAALVLNKDFDLKRGDEIIVPAVGWSTSYYPLQQYGLKLRFVDINFETLNFNEENINDAITSKTKGILAINILGNPNNLIQLKKICKKKNLLLIEDNCESLGAKLNKKYSGTYGIAGSFSFYYSHHINTIEGGMISTNNKSLYEYLLSLRSHGWTRDLDFKNSIKNKSGLKFNDCFRFVLPGYNVRPNEINGISGCLQLKKIKTFLFQRRKNAEIFQNLFNKEDFCQIQKEIGKSSWFGFSIILKKNLENKRSFVINELEKNGIETRPIVSGNFLENPVIKFFDYSIFRNLKNTQKLDRNGFFIGNDHRDLSKQLKKVKEIIYNLNLKFS